jgi:opacity protein-like surface antigen
MKSIKTIIVGALLLGAQFASAQMEQGQSVLTLNLGYSLTADLITTIFDDIASETSASSIPVIILGVDYGLTDRFSMGLSGTLQTMSLDVTDYSWIDENNNEVIENASADLSRWQVALTPRFHYGKGGDLDLYSGLRIGITGWGTSFTSTDPDFEGVLDVSGSRFSLGLTPFGARYYFSDMVGANMEINLGAPYIFAGGINLRF